MNLSSIIEIVLEFRIAKFLDSYFLEPSTVYVLLKVIERSV